MERDIYNTIRPEQTVKTKVKKPVNKDTLIIAIIVAVILLLTAGIVIYYFWGANNEVIVTYDGGDITRGEYEAVYRYWAPQLYYYGYDSETISGIIVDEILLNEVIYKKATDAGYKISDEDKTSVDEQFADEDSVAALRANGINPDILKEFFYNNAVVSAYLEDVKEQTTTEELKAAIFAEEGQNADLNLYKTRHILISVDANATDEQKAEALKEANDLLAKVKKGEDFAELATKNSDDTGTATNGGAFDMVNNELVDEDYRKAALTLKEGQLYGNVVKSDFGYFIIKLESIEKDGRLTNEDDLETHVNDVIEQTINEVFNEEEHQEELNNAKALAAKLNLELGIAATGSEE